MAVPDREGPHTGVLMLAINVLIVLIVIAVVLIPRDGKAPAASPNMAPGPSVPNVPEWPSLPEANSPAIVPAGASERVEEAVGSLLNSLARRDLLGAARWIVPTMSVGEVTNRLASLTTGLPTATNTAWRLAAPLTANPEGLTVVVRVGSRDAQRVELDFRETSVGWRVARLQWTGPTNATPVNLDFTGPRR